MAKVKVTVTSSTKQAYNLAMLEAVPLQPPCSVDLSFKNVKSHNLKVEIGLPWESHALT